MEPIILNVYFDGGTYKNNPGDGYGSFEIWDGEDNLIEKKYRIQFGKNITNNQAEYLSLIESLKEIIKIAENNINLLNKIKLNIFSDSKLVVMQVSKKWRAKHEKTVILLNKTKQLLKPFKRCNIYWQNRENNVARFGH